jgi:hypothetical protein
MAEPKYQIRKIAVAQKLSAIGRLGKTDNPGGENLTAQSASEKPFRWRRGEHS